MKTLAYVLMCSLVLGCLGFMLGMVLDSFISLDPFNNLIGTQGVKMWHLLTFLGISWATLYALDDAKKMKDAGR